MRKILRWGLLSTARINAKVIPAIRLAKRSQLMAVASRDITRARQYAAEWEIPIAFGCYDDLLSSDVIDAVYISLPNDQHAEWSIRALKAGKHVLCEKPLAINAPHVEQMIEAARSSGKVLAEAFMYLHHPQTKEVLHAIQTGKIGVVRAIHGSFHFSLTSMKDPRANPAQGGGSIWDIGVYPISYAQKIMGTAPEEVIGWERNGSTGIDMTFVGQMRYADRAFAQFSSSFESPQQMGVSIYGSEGKIDITRPFTGMEKGVVILTSPSGVVDRLRVPRKHLYLGEIEDIENAALDGHPQLVPLPESASHVKTVLALLQSAQENHPIICNWPLD